MRLISRKTSRDSTSTPLIEAGESSSRTRGVQDHEATPWTRFMFWRAKRRYGHVPLSTRIRAYDPKLLQLAERMGQYTLAVGAASPQLKELGQLKVAIMVGCPF